MTVVINCIHETELKTKIKSPVSERQEKVRMTYEENFTTNELEIKNI